MLQGAGLRRRQVTRISIKGIIDVGTAVSEGKQHVCAPFGGKKLACGSAAGARKAEIGGGVWLYVLRFPSQLELQIHDIH